MSFFCLFTIMPSFVCVLHRTAYQHELYVLFLLHKSTIMVDMPLFFKKSSRPKSPFFFHKKVEKCLRSDRLREVVLFKGIKGMILCDI